MYLLLQKAFGTDLINPSCGFENLKCINTGQKIDLVTGVAMSFAALWDNIKFEIQQNSEHRLFEVHVNHKLDSTMMQIFALREKLVKVISKLLYN